MAVEALSRDSSDVESLAGTETDGLSDFEPNSDRLMLIIVSLACAVFFLDRGLSELFAFLRFDENLTGWITSGSFADSVARSWEHQGQSPLYFAGLWAWQQIAGSSEVSMRVPSILAFGAVLWQFKVIAREIDRPEIWPFAAVFMTTINIGIVEARPYMFMILALVVATRAGVQFLVDGSWRAGVIWAVSSAAALYFQPFAFYSLLAHGPLVVAGLRRGHGPKVVRLLFLGLVLIVPLVPQILNLRARQETLVYVAMPDVLDLLATPVIVIGLLAILSGVLVHRSQSWRAVAELDGSVVWHLVGALLLPIVGLFLQSHLTGNSVFVDRYHMGAVPAGALLVGLVLSRLSQRGQVAGCVVLIVSSALLFSPTWSRDWYSAAEAIESVDPSTEIWTVTGYIESNHAQYFADDFDNDYLNAPLIWHGANRPMTPVPRVVGPETQVILDRFVDDAVEARQKIVLVESSESVRQPGPVYAEEQLVARGFVVADVEEAFAVLVTTLVPGDDG